MLNDLICRADLLICKTRYLSIKTQGMINRAMNFGLLFETALALFLIYTPGLNDAIGTEPLRIEHFFPALPFVLFIFAYDECRKYLMRALTPGNWFCKFFNCVSVACNARRHTQYFCTACRIAWRTNENLKTLSASHFLTDANTFY